MGVEDAALGEQMAQADVVVLRQQVDVADVRAARLARHIGEPVARSGRHGDDVAEVDLVLHKSVENARREDAAHASTLQNQPCMVVYLHKTR